MMNFRWENKSNARYYHAILTRDLWGDWVVIKSWGGKTKRGGVKNLFCSSYSEGAQLLGKINKIRQKHGYQLQSSHLNNL